MNTAKIFWSGRSQAVRLPKEFRFDANEVRIRRQGDAIVLEPVAKDWAWLEAVQGPVDEDFVRATDTEQAQPEQSNPALDFFK